MNDIKFVGVNDRGNKCYINKDKDYIEEVNGHYYVLNEYEPEGFIGINGEPDYELNPKNINIIKDE